MHVVLRKLRIPVCNIPVSLQLASREMLKDSPLDIGTECRSEFITLSLTCQGLMGGSRRDIDDEFKRVDADQPAMPMTDISA